MKIFLLLFLLLNLYLSAKEIYSAIGSFSLNTQKKTIDFNEQNISSLDDFILVHDDLYIYILDFKTGKRVGKFTLFVLDYCVFIESDKNSSAKIIYTTALDSLVGENYHIPQAMLHELIYKDGVYYEE